MKPNCVSSASFKFIKLTQNSLALPFHWVATKQLQRLGLNILGIKVIHNIWYNGGLGCVGTNSAKLPTKITFVQRDPTSHWPCHLIRS